MPQTLTGFKVSYERGSVVTFSKDNVPPERFDAELQAARGLIAEFRQSKPGSTWGCDGIGYDIQKKRGEVRVMRSGVGPRKFEAGVRALANKPGWC